MTLLLVSAGYSYKALGQGEGEYPAAEERVGLSENVTKSCQDVLFMFRRPLQILSCGSVSRKVLVFVCWALNMR